MIELVENHIAFPTASAVNSSVALTGSDFAPSTPANANDPGLTSQSLPPNVPATEGASPMKAHHWLWIALAAIAVLFGLWYFGIIGGTSAAG